MHVATVRLGSCGSARGGQQRAVVDHRRRAKRWQRKVSPCASQLQPPETSSDDEILREEEPPKFRPFVPQNAMQQRMVQFRRSYPLPGGATLVVQPATEPWVPAAADVLTEAFADSMGYVSAYKNFLRRQIRKYLHAHVALPPKAAVLVALLVPPSPPAIQAAADPPLHEVPDAAGVAAEAGAVASGPAAQPVDPTAGPGPGPGSAALIAAVEVSFTESSRSKYMTLNSPGDRPYLCNMAVGPEWRGRGHGSLLLAAAEDLVGAVGESVVYLHVRFQDAPAGALYRKAGYVAAAQDSLLVRLVGLDRRYLMRKTLPGTAAAPGS